ncbi:uncharacterized protein LOC132725941 [Ruditapes philippinarum]|uniref:uncharacterized protein LOC132725941 n=1 Tax=Ruditapes philippinarum TaxID=129788 RepID=UPI00295A624D|nr:uncharacterized protein LOC132725941 [Ruditapes philippinarum]
MLYGKMLYALIDKDAEGRAQIEYKPAKQIHWDGSNAHVIAQPKSDLDIEVKVDACLELIDYLKSEKPPSGVVLNKTKISLSPTKEYRLGHEFERTKEILGKGNSAGDIVVVKDKKTGQEHAYKTMMISYFRKEEVKCWVDMSDSGCVPALYLFKIENNKVSIHMEILKNAKTLRSIIDEHMAGFYENAENRSLVKPFSLYVLDGALEAVTQLHNKGWVHHDLHGGNVMVQKTGEEKLGVKVLDFGLARKLEDYNGLNYRGFHADIGEIVRLFSALYTGGLEFDNVLDLRKNWKDKLTEVTEMMKMNVDDRKELFCLVDAALKVVHPNQVEEYRQQVKTELGKAMGQSEKEIMRKVVAILFPEDFQPIHQDIEDSADAMGDFDVADSIFLSNHHDYMDHQGDNHDLDLEWTANQVTDEYLEMVRMTLGIDLH